MKAGLTGLAQVRGRNDISWDEKVVYDNEYIDLFKKQGIWIDIKILFESVFKVFQKEDIYEKKADTSMSAEEAAAFEEEEIIRIRVRRSLSMSQPWKTTPPSSAPR